jgi:membrane protein implicated in regulation of membrane protease activity
MNHWWMWIVLGLVLAAIELLTPGGLFIIFFGVAAVVVGVLTLLGVVDRPWVEWLIFPVVALIALRLFRAPLLARLQKDSRPDNVDSLVGETAIAAGSMAPGEHGRVELRGSMWSGQNVGSRTIEAASRCRVVAVEGLRLDVAAS